MHVCWHPASPHAAYLIRRCAEEILDAVIVRVRPRNQMVERGGRRRASSGLERHTPSGPGLRRVRSRRAPPGTPFPSSPSICRRSTCTACRGRAKLRLVGFTRGMAPDVAGARGNDGVTRSLRPEVTSRSHWLRVWSATILSAIPRQTQIITESRCCAS
jgi:hypothetical protein